MLEEARKRPLSNNNGGDKGMQEGDACLIIHCEEMIFQTEFKVRKEKESFARVKSNNRTLDYSALLYIILVSSNCISFLIMPHIHILIHTHKVCVFIENI